MPLRPFLLGAALALVGAAAGAADATWRVTVDGADLSTEARVLLAGGAPLVDLDGLAGALRLAIDREAGDVVVRNADGERWRGAAGGPTLRGASELALGPLRYGSAQWWVRAEVAARLSGFRVTTDAQAARIAFARAAEAAPPPTPVQPLPRAEGGVAPAPAAWASFTVPKTASERAETARLESYVAAAPPRAPDRLPAAHESLRVGIGLDFLDRGGAAAEVFGDGSVAGVETAFDLLTTGSADGLRLRSGGVDLRGEDGRWHARLGDLSSELVGSARGLRVEAARGPQTFGLGVYARRSSVGAIARPIVAVRDELRPRPGLRLAGEAGSDGSWMTQAAARGRRADASAFVRRRPGSDGDWGASGSLALGAGWGLDGTVQHGGAADVEGGSTALDLRSLHLRWARGDGTAWSAGVSSFRAAATRTTLGEVFGQRASGPWRFFGRLQERRIEVRGLADALRAEELLGGIALAGARGRADLQVSANRVDGGGVALAGQVAVAARLSRRTELRALATVTDGAVRDRRLEWRYAVDDDLAVSAEVGTLPAFELGEATANPGATRVRVGVRKVWHAATPTRGGRIAGWVRDRAGRGWAGVTVVVGTYRVTTDGDGAFELAHLPPGTYAATVDLETLPPGMSAAGPARTVVVTQGSEDALLFTLVPLGGVTGWVYVDRDGDHRRGADEGLEGAVVVLDDLAATSDADGAFQFADVAPGRHVLRLVGERLGPELRAAAGATRELGLPAGASLAAVELRVDVAPRPVLYQVLR